ncbi:hypothetical protein H0H87_011284 [Tephrocybe sp. NHM501043]|nr:hypothetical protein H0H87_011284 [Tephrocybe sp. NHM501043]
MVVSVADMPRPNRQDLVSPPFYPPSTYDSFGIPLLYSHASEESETGGGGPYGQPGTPGLTDSFVGQPSSSGGQYLPQPQRDHQRNPRGHRLAPDHGHVSLPPCVAHLTGSLRIIKENYDFSALTGQQPIGYQESHGPLSAYAPHGHGSRQPHGSQLYYGNESQYTHSRTTAPDIPGPAPDMHRRGRSRESMPTPDFRYGPAHSGFEIPNQRNIFSSQGRSAPYPSSPSHSAGSHSPHLNNDSPRSMSHGLPGEETGKVIHRALDDWLRESAGIRLTDPVNLWSLPDPPTPTTRPNVTYKVLVSLAIYGSKYGRLSLQEIYNVIEERFPYYRNLPEEIGRDGKSGGKKWQRSVRHNLSLEAIFVNENRNINEPGKGGYWHVTNRHGYGQKRERKRKGKSSSSSTSSRESHSVKAEDDDDIYDDEEDDLSEDLQIGSSSGAHRSGRSSRLAHTAHTFPTLPSNTLVSYDSVPAFGQPSLGPHSSRTRHQPPRTSSMSQLPDVNMQATQGVRSHPTRPSTVPLYPGHVYEPMADPDQYHLPGQPGYSFSTEGDEASRRSQRDKGKRRGH